MKIKGFTNKLYRLNSNSIKCSVSNFDKLKEGKIIDLKNFTMEELHKAEAKKIKYSALYKDAKNILEGSEFHKLIGDILYHIIIAQSEDGSIESDNRANNA